MSRGGTKKDKLDPWAELVQEATEEAEQRQEEGPSETRVGLFEAIKRFFILLFWRPVSTIAYTLGLAYGSVCIYLFAHGDMIEPYGFNEVVNESPTKAVIPPGTLVVTREGVALLLIWLILPPIWFFIESYVFCKTQQQRDVVKEAQEISVKVWLALLGVMAILAK